MLSLQEFALALIFSNWGKWQYILHCRGHLEDVHLTHACWLVPREDVTGRHYLQIQDSVSTADTF